MKRTFAAALLGAALLVPALCSAQTITIKGSDTMVILGQAWAEAYMKSNKGVEISVQGGGSGTGIAALINGTTDICQASRPMKPKEQQQCKARNIKPLAIPVALDGVSIAVNSRNPIKSITKAQLKDIYTGKVTNWKQLGGADAPIVVLSRESSSGTYVYFQDHVLDGQNYSRTVLLMPSTKAIQQELTNNRNAIGYGGLAYFDGKRNVKIIPVSDGGEAVFPSDENVKSGKYPLARPLYFYTAGKKGGVIGKFIDYVLSPAGQAVVNQTGYVAIK